MIIIAFLFGIAILILLGILLKLIENIEKELEEIRADFDKEETHLSKIDKNE
jgi:hypothetical protein